jgi:tRNA threonylcarbamoyladenosine biosynthesis protein TsaE
MELITKSEEETRELGRRISQILEPGDIMLLCGDLGAGKTRLVQGIAQGLAIPEMITSPTFAIIKEYAGRLPLIHIDLFRLNCHDLPSLGLEEYLEGEGVICVEWGEKLKGMLWKEALLIEILWQGENERLLCFLPEGESWRIRLAGMSKEVIP